MLRVRKFTVLAPAAAIFACAPRAVIVKRNAEMVKILRMPDVVERLAAKGAEVVGNAPDEFARIIKADVIEWATAVRNSGAKAD